MLATVGHYHLSIILLNLITRLLLVFHYCIYHCHKSPVSVYKFLLGISLEEKLMAHRICMFAVLLDIAIASCPNLHFLMNCLVVPIAPRPH